MFMWGTGDLYFAGVLSERDVVPYPSLADALWLGFYLPAYAAIASLLRRRVGTLSKGARLDALIGGLGVGSAGATLAFGVVLANTTGSAATIATNLAYPVGDLVLLALVGAADHGDGMEVGRRLALDRGRVHHLRGGGQHLPRRRSPRGRMRRATSSTSAGPWRR